MKTASTRNSRADQTDNGRPTSDDPVLTGLRQAEAQYRKTYLILEQQTAEARRELDLARRENEALSHELALQRRDVEQERLHARHQRETANALAATLKEIHRSFLSGNIFDHILRACLALTGATRGLYVTASDLVSARTTPLDRSCVSQPPTIPARVFGSTTAIYR